MNTYRHITKTIFASSFPSPLPVDKDSFINMLLSQDGLMSVYQTFGNYRFKGKGHERADLRLLMTKYEEWTQKLCPVCVCVMSYISV